ncbi:synaptonemal complex central element protein 3 [Cyclopterus lumpus]|uniref:Synaptonemal complex central element protein 3 n=1 Tax=Cyclopterus lumpus TaxID=8103 RepID=A0A8C3AV33_CYCLU|nr:synaptonemal complex central element protein 3 [Cyclopterus lumpus]
MADSSSIPEPPQDSSDDDVLELNKDLERIIEAIENISVQLTWGGYDMVALRTSPELGTSMRNMNEAFHRCRAIICGDHEKEPARG